MSKSLYEKNKPFYFFQYESEHVMSCKEVQITSAQRE